MMSKDIEIVIKISVPHEFGGSIKVDSNTEKKDHLGLSDFDRKELEKWKEKNPKFNEHNVPKNLMTKLIWMQLGAVRKENGYTQNVLADAANIKQVTISHFEHGRTKPSPETQERIANALGYELNELVEILKNSIDWNEHEYAIKKYMRLRKDKVPVSEARHSLRKVGVENG